MSLTWSTDKPIKVNTIIKSRHTFFTRYFLFPRVVVQDIAISYTSQHNNQCWSYITGHSILHIIQLCILLGHIFINYVQYVLLDASQCRILGQLLCKYELYHTQEVHETEHLHKIFLIIF